MLYPVLTQSRLLSDLSGVWNFKLDNGKGFEEKWYEKPLKDADTMPVPASYNDLKEGTDFRDHYGWVFYQRNISVPEYVKSQRIVLRCAAVTHYAMIYLNGKLICEHKGGFLPFEVELNDHLQDGDNLLTIAVNNVIDYTTLPVGGKANMMSGMMGGMGAGASDKPQNNPNFDFFNYCGITRPVKIYTTPETYINDITVTADIDFTKEDGDQEYRKQLEEKAKREGNDSLYEMLKQVDPKSTEKIHKNNVKRVIRALEFYKLNGYPISEHNEKEAAKTSPYNFAYFVLNHKRDILYDRINRRVDIMVEQGLIDEVKRLKEEGYEKTMVSMQGIGYRQVFEYLEGNLSLEDTIEQIKKDTRHFAKRQLTWFGREREVCMVDKSQFGSEDEILTYMLTILKEKGIYDGSVKELL